MSPRRPSSGVRWTLPNLLTLVRALCVPVLVVLLTAMVPSHRPRLGTPGWLESFWDLFLYPHLREAPSPEDWRLSLLTSGIFVLAALTDIADGWLARRWNLVTPLGQLLDPLADKLLISAPLIMLVPLARVPAWMVVVIVGRELAVTGLRGIASAEGLVIPASTGGKYKTVFQSAAIALLLAHYPWMGVSLHRLGMVLLWTALAYTLVSGVEYFVRYFEATRGAPAA